MGKLCGASNFALGTSIKSVSLHFCVIDDIDIFPELISISDDAIYPALPLGSMITRL